MIEHDSVLATLIEISQSLMSATEPESLLQMILESAIRLFSAEGCSLALLDEKEQYLTFAFVVGGAEVERFRLESGQGLIGWVADNGQGVICNDVSQDQRFFGNV